MKKIIWSVFILTISHLAFAETGIVIKKFRSCDYFIADGPKGLYVLEWFGGHDPYEREKIIGNIGSFGMKSVVYPNSNSVGKVWVEDFLESPERALEIIRDKCN
jgi:hypothetical protein